MIIENQRQFFKVTDFLCGLGHIQLSSILNNCTNITGADGSVVVEALCYKPEGHGFHS
jgi:hypothetical protein